MRLLTKTLSPRIVRDKPPTLSADALLSLGDTHGAHITAEALALGDSSGLGVPLARHTRRAVAHLARLARAERRARGAGSAALGRDEAKAVRAPPPNCCPYPCPYSTLPPSLPPPVLCSSTNKLRERDLCEAAPPSAVTACSRASSPRRQVLASVAKHEQEWHAAGAGVRAAMLVARARALALLGSRTACEAAAAEAMRAVASPWTFEAAAECERWAPHARACGAPRDAAGQLRRPVRWVRTLWHDRGVATLLRRRGAPQACCAQCCAQLRGCGAGGHATRLSGQHGGPCCALRSFKGVAPARECLLPQLNQRIVLF